MKNLEEIINQVLSQTQKIILDKEKQIKLSLAAFISGSHVLIEDMPGVGKTTLAKTLSRTIGLGYSRIQFTNDLLPADITGINFYNAGDGSFSFKKGPVFSQFLLADEINRASSKTQSALLEAMEEKQVSIDGKSHKLPEPFFVIATKNPFEEVGTYMLPSSQLDRFAISFSLGYPSKEAERKILSLKNEININTLQSLQPQEIQNLFETFEQIHVSEDVLDIIQEIVHFTRESSLYITGLSPRAALTLLKLSKAWAMISSRDFVIPSDVLEVLPHICYHRLESKGEKKTLTEIIDEILKNIHIDT